jgi:predicted PurR-regulated permease PerM
MAERSLAAGFQRVLIILGCIVLVIASLSLGQKILVPLAVAILLTFILAPLVLALQRLGVGRVPAAITVVLLTLVILGGLGWLVTAQLNALAVELPKHQDTIKQKLQGLQGAGEEPIARLLRMVREIAEEVDKPVETNRPPGVPEPPVPVPLIVKSEETPFLATVKVIAVPLLEGLVTGGLVLVLVTFMLVMREDLRNRMLRLLGHGRITSSTKAVEDATRRISRYLLTQSIINVGFGTLLALGLSLIGVPYALLWGVLAACLRFIPYVGIWAALLMPFSYGIMVFSGRLEPLLTAAPGAALELVTANIVEPLLVGHSTGVSPLALLIAAIFWAWLWGPIGLLLSTPLTSCLVVLGKFVPDLEFLDILLGSQPVLEPDLRYYQRLVARDQDEAEELVEEFVGSHPVEEVFDDLLVPALIHARADRERGVLSEWEEEFVLRASRDIVETLPSSTAPIKDASGDGTRVIVAGCPARDERDEAALAMFGRLLQECDCRLETMSSDALCAEVVTHVENEKPDLVYIAALPPGGLAQARYLVKRLRARIPEVKIGVGRWGQKDNIDKVRQRLREAGADYVSLTLLESRRQVISEIRVLTAPIISSN